MVYVISYDLNDHDKNYEGVSRAIIDISSGCCVHHLDSTWLIKSSALSATDIFDKIKPEMDQKVSGECAETYNTGFILRGMAKNMDKFQKSVRSEATPEVVSAWG